MAGELRVWQQEALERLLGRHEDFLTVATPGAGKTTFALKATEKLWDLGEIRFVIVVVPTTHLRGQWATAAAGMGIKLDDRFTNADGVVARDYDGVVVTYQTVASAPHLWRRLSSNPAKPTLVVFDEIHHAGDDENAAWGAALTAAFQPAARRLLLSGTPFRTDKRPIPFVRYDETGRAMASYNYDYGRALADGEVVRPIVFPAMDGDAQWRRAGEMTTTSVALADTDEETLSPALRAALDPHGDWIPSVLREADDALSKVRLDTPDAGGLVIAFNQTAAYAYAQILRALTGEDPIVAVSDDPEASASISRFGKGTSRWIVAVQMVSEGVDIPRLAVGVYATRVRTQLFFIQVVGRFVRMRGGDDETCARLFIPSINPLLEYARDIEKTVDAVISNEEKQVRDRQENDDGSGPTLFEVEVVGSSAAVHHSTIASGESITTEEKTQAESILAMLRGSVPPSMTSEAVALILRTAGARPATAAVPAQPDAPKLSDQKANARRVIKRKVGKLNIQTGRQHSHIHAELNKICGGNIGTASHDDLVRRIDILNRWLADEA
ncbi:DEAD/DEAH box helicase [Parafrankia elaeagni]|uniref:DEAD/DEAH box helicase n=1 Tax=Parafrankia elaeagni TaxID=222534 RepID=UPI0003658D07|nr:DEAD/DEAH box helicase [Parafrankia elaeagni]